MTANPREPMVHPHDDEAGDWRALIPHQGAMSLIDGIVAWDAESIDAFAISHRSAAHPLRSDGRLRAVHLCEYGAQAMAIHGGLVARASGGVAAPGYLVSLRAIELAVDRIDDLPGALAIHAEKIAGGDAAWQYAFRIAHAGVEIASGRAAVLATSAKQGG
jgi:predicted hotdog family 3-hydroxylacyl-ACP dehydratase